MRPHRPLSAHRSPTDGHCAQQQPTAAPRNAQKQGSRKTETEDGACISAAARADSGAPSPAAHGIRQSPSEEGASARAQSSARRRLRSARGRCKTRAQAPERKARLRRPRGHASGSRRARATHRHAYTRACPGAWPGRTFRRCRRAARHQTRRCPAAPRRLLQAAAAARCGCLPAATRIWRAAAAHPRPCRPPPRSRALAEGCGARCPGVPVTRQRLLGNYKLLRFWIGLRSEARYTFRVATHFPLDRIGTTIVRQCR